MVLGSLYRAPAPYFLAPPIPRLLIHQKASSYCPPIPSALIFPPQHRPTAMELGDHGQKPRAKTTLSSIELISQVFCHRGGKFPSNPTVCLETSGGQGRRGRWGAAHVRYLDGSFMGFCQNSSKGFSWITRAVGQRWSGPVSRIHLTWARLCGHLQHI